MIKVGLLLLIGFVCLIQADNVPVLIRNANGKIDHTLKIGNVLSQDELENLLDDGETNVKIVLVDESDDQDFRDSNIETYSKYLQSVEDPFPTMKTFFDKKEINLEVKDLKMNFKKALEEFNKEFKGSVFLTSLGLKSNDLKVIKKRAAEDEETPVEEDKSIKVFGDKCAAIYDSIYLVDNSNNQKKNNRLDLNLQASNFECSEKLSSLKLTVSSNKTLFGNPINELNLIFSQTPNTRYWVMLPNSSLTTDKESLGLTYMGAPYGMETPNEFSFVCTRTYFLLKNNTLSTKPTVKVSLYIEGLQIQPMGVMVNETSFTFGRVNYCQGFFTSGIWMALMTTLLLTFILAVGVSFLCNINTMDRFDDPKGKPLNIAIEK